MCMFVQISVYVFMYIFCAHACVYVQSNLQYEGLKLKYVCGGKEGVEFGISMEIKFWFMTAMIML